MDFNAPAQAVLAYLIGSIPSAYIAGRWSKGLDIRQHGSGNLGATNVFRVLGPGPGVAVLVADIAKGAVAVLFLPRLSLFGPMAAAGGGFGGPAAAWWPCALGLAAVLGHSYTVFLKFKGGKGVATSLGVFLGLAPLATLCALLVFGAVFWLTRMVSAGSLAAAAVLPAALACLREGQPMAWTVQAESGATAAGPVLWLALALASLVWLRHIPNIRRILAGTESRLGARKREAH